MRHKNKEGTRRKWKAKSFGLATFLALSFSLSTLAAQESVNTTGGNATGSGGSVGYSVGQVVYTTSTGTNGSVAQGVQQPYEISVVTAIEEATGINLVISAYPNPTIDYLTLSINDYSTSNNSLGHDLSLLYYHLYDMQGKVVQNEKITGNQTSIFMGNLLPAIYFVKVVQGNKELKTFKIIKK